MHVVPQEYIHVFQINRHGICAILVKNAKSSSACCVFAVMHDPSPRSSIGKRFVKFLLIIVVL